VNVTSSMLGVRGRESARDREILRDLAPSEEGRVYEWVSTLSSRVRYPMVFQHSVETAKGANIV